MNPPTPAISNCSVYIANHKHLPPRIFHSQQRKGKDPVATLPLVPFPRVSQVSLPTRRGAGSSPHHMVEHRVKSHGPNFVELRSAMRCRSVPRALGEGRTDARPAGQNKIPAPPPMRTPQGAGEPPGERHPEGPPPPVMPRCLKPALAVQLRRPCTA